MQGLNRRSFCGTALLALAALAAPALAFAKPKPPRLWADGKHDDTEALQWLIDEAHRKGGGVVQVPAGTLLLSKTIRIRAGVELRGEPFVKLKVDPGAGMQTVFYAEGNERSRVAVSGFDLTAI
jgi:polygalacturonase